MIQPFMKRTSLLIIEVCGNSWWTMFVRLEKLESINECGLEKLEFY